MGFTKLDSCILDSSIWFESLAARVVFIAFLAKADKDGFVAASYQGMCHVANVKKEDFDEAVKILESPDNDSRSPEYDGRRIKKIDGGWIVLNYKKYRERSYSSNPDAERQRKHRKKGVTNSVTICDMSQKACDISASASASASVLNTIPEHRSCSELLSKRILERRQQKIDESVLVKWDNEVRLMVKNDSRTIEQIKNMINECHNMEPTPSGFSWRENILSMSKLRERWNEGKIYIGMNVKKPKQGSIEMSFLNESKPKNGGIG